MPKVVALKSWLASKERRREFTTVVLHATAGSTASGAIVTLRLRKLSYHYIIEKSGVIHKCVPMNNVAYHAGISFGPDGIQVNEYSIGISFVNLNNGKDPYTREQVESAAWLVGELKRAIPTLKWITSHAAVSPGRKTDPRGLEIAQFADRVGLDLYTPNGAIHVGGVV